MAKVTMIDCTRCGGTGHYSYNMIHGTVCFKCNGAKKIPAKNTKVKVTSLFEYAETGDTVNIHKAGYCEVIAIEDGDFIRKEPSMFGGYDEVHYPQMVIMESLADGKTYKRVRYPKSTEYTDGNGTTRVVNKKDGVWYLKK
jgi:hypothetical protein